MKKLIILVTILSVFVILSCNKKDLLNSSDDFPVWLQQKITELIGDQKLCEITDVTVIEYNGKRYYHIYAGFWSCVYCQLFDEQGNRPNWDNKGWEDFFSKKRDIQVRPACK